MEKALQDLVSDKEEIKCGNIKTVQKMKMMTLMMLLKKYKRI